MKILMLFLLCLPLSAADAFRIRAEYAEGRVTTTYHGTAFVMDGLVFSACHIIKDPKAKDIYVIKDDGSRVNLSVKYASKDWDVVIFEPAERLPDTSGKSACPASINGGEIQRLKCKVIGDCSAEIHGFTHGASGSPVYKDGKLVGMATSFLKDADGGEKSYVKTVPFVPVFVLKELEKK